jgi:hypothetical protein
VTEQRGDAGTETLAAPTSSKKQAKKLKKEAAAREAEAKEAEAKAAEAVAEPQPTAGVTDRADLLAGTSKEQAAVPETVNGVPEVSEAAQKEEIPSQTVAAAGAAATAPYVPAQEQAPGMLCLCIAL